MASSSSIAANILKMNNRISACLAVSPKSDGNAFLLAASKTKPVSALQEAYDAGQRIFGENYVEDFLSK